MSVTDIDEVESRNAPEFCPKCKWTLDHPDECGYLRSRWAAPRDRLHQDRLRQHRKIGMALLHRELNKANGLPTPKLPALQEERECPVDHHRFIPTRADGVYCTNACRQKAYRTRRRSAWLLARSPLPDPGQRCIQTPTHGL